MKQQTISKFFAPRTINGLDRALERSQSQSQSQPQSQPQSKEPRTSIKRTFGVEEDKENSSGEDDEPQPAKRTRTATRRAIVNDDEEEEEGDGQNGNGQSKDRGTVAAPSSTTPSSIAERFAFSQIQEENGMEVDDENEEDNQRRQELHRRFVAKLGKPDSLPRHHHQPQHVEAIIGPEDDEDGEGDEADEPMAAPPPPPKGRAGGKKGRAKLTPLEVQFLEIKRKHMDAVLIVEVGYKFRFFGEDARIAAKELGIVCIPGKYRYDEGMWFVYYGEQSSNCQ